MSLTDPNLSFSNKNETRDTHRRVNRQRLIVRVARRTHSSFTFSPHRNGMCNALHYILPTFFRNIQCEFTSYNHFWIQSKAHASDSKLVGMLDSVQCSDLF